MAKLILSAIVALGTIAALVHWAWKRYGGIDAQKRNIKKQIKKIRKEMRKALRYGHADTYECLLDERYELLEKLRDLGE